MKTITPEMAAQLLVRGSNLMKTYGQIDFEERSEHAAKVFEGIKLRPAWEELTDAARAISEAGAQAVIEEFKQRHNIVIPPEED